MAKVAFCQINDDNLADAFVFNLCTFLDCYLTCPECLLAKGERCNYADAKIVIPVDGLAGLIGPIDFNRETMKDLTDEQIKDRMEAYLARLGKETIERESM